MELKDYYTKRSLQAKILGPISLLDLDYKILTKVLAIRLKDIMDKLLYPLKSSGVKGRNILNKILNLET